HDLRSKADAVGGDLRRVDRRELAQTLAQVAEARLNELLAFERGLVFAVLAKIAELDRFANFLWQRDVELVLQSFRFRGEFLLQLFDHIARSRAFWVQGKLTRPADRPGAWVTFPSYPACAPLANDASDDRANSARKRSIMASRRSYRR